MGGYALVGHSLSDAVQLGLRCSQFSAQVNYRQIGVIQVLLYRLFGQLKIFPVPLIGGGVSFHFCMNAPYYFCYFHLV